MTHKKRIVITGLGVISPIGNNYDEFSKSVMEGKSGADKITLFDATQFETQFACEVKGLNLEDFIDRKSANRMDRYSHFGVISGEMALKDANINMNEIDRNRFSVIYGSGIGGMQTYHNEFIKLTSSGPSRVSPFLIPMFIPNMAAGLLSIRNNLKGPSYATVSACATSLHAILDAYMLLQLDYVDFVLCGGSEATVSPLAIAGFNQAKAMSTRNDDPKTASRPYDIHRNGFVMGEGGGALIMETYESAKARNAKIYAELAGVAASSDAHHITAPHPEGEGAIYAMQTALRIAGLEPKDIDYINTHGTSTPLGDVAEVRAIKKLFGSAINDINLSSSKSMTGHLLGAAGVLETIVGIIAMEKQMAPPTINVFEQDPQIDVNVTPNKAVARKIKYVLNNGFGFGGHNGTVILKKM